MTPSHRFAGVDLLRFFAAFLVMSFHLALWSWAAKGGTTASIIRGAVSFPELEGAASWGWVGVPIFFVISGFVIAFSAADATPLAFLRRRFLRLFPAAVLCATITAAVLVGEGISSLGPVAGRYLNSLIFNPLGPWVDGAYWTLGIEIDFYGLVFLLLVIGRREWMPGVLAVIGIATSAVAIAKTMVPALNLTLAFTDSRAGELLLLKHGMEFSLGVMLWMGWARGGTSTRTAVALICAAGAVVQISRAASSDLVAAIAVTVWLLCMVLLFFAILQDDVVSRIAGRAAPAIAMIGLSTYPLYLLHDVVGAAVLRELALAGVNRFLALGMAMLLMIALALLVTRFPERALRQLLTLAPARLFPRATNRANDVPVAPSS